MKNEVLFDINIGYGCNYRCKYCHEKYSNINYKSLGMSNEVITRYVQYLFYMKKLYKKEMFSAQIFGGEPLLYLDAIKTLVQRGQSVVNRFTIITNGSLIHQNKDLLLELNKYKSTLKIAVSYDFALQNESRAKGSYATIREAIKWLYQQGLLGKVITVIDAKNLPRIHEVFFDFIKLREECPTLKCQYNLSLYEDLDKFDKNGTIESLELIKNFLKENPQHQKSFIHNVMGSGDIFSEGGGCASMVISGITPEGDIYPDYSIPYRNDRLRELTYQGNIFEDFDILNSRREEKLKMVQNSLVPDKCTICESTCKINRWRFMLDGTDPINSPPSDKVCEITQLVHSYIGEFR